MTDLAEKCIMKIHLFSIRRNIMKKRILSILLAVTLMTGILSGCGEKNDKEDKNAEPVQEEASKEETTDDNVIDLGNGMMMEAPGEDDGLIEMEGVVTVMEDGDIDWLSAYADYYTKEDMMPENVKVYMTTDMEGITMNIVVATVGETSYMGYEINNAVIDLYAMGEQIYARTEIAGEESWIVAPVATEEDVESIMTMSGENTLIDAETVTACTYVETVVEEGVTYDVLSLSVDAESGIGSAYYYVNRDTQMVEKCIMEQDGQEAVCLIEEISSIELPAEAAGATEGTTDDVAGALFAVIFAAMSEGME